MDLQENKQYEKPTIITYSEDEILEIIGPANTCGSPFFGNGHEHGHEHHW